MRCPACDTENADDRRFCAECGAALARACSSCGFANQPDARFCGGCGNSLAAAEPAPAPERYTPKHLAERILGSKGVLEGERKQVTVLFADIRGSLELIQGADPEVAHELLDKAIGAMMEAVRLDWLR